MANTITLAVKKVSMDRYRYGSRGRNGARLRGTIRLTVLSLVILAIATVTHAQQPAATLPLVLDGVTVIDVQQGHHSRRSGW